MATNYPPTQHPALQVLGSEAEIKFVVGARSESVHISSNPAMCKMVSRRLSSAQLLDRMKVIVPDEGVP